MGFELDNKTLLYVTIGLFIVQFIIMIYYVPYTVDKENKNNNKKLIKKLSGHINSTFDEYIGSNTDTHKTNMLLQTTNDQQNQHIQTNINDKKNQHMQTNNNDNDSIDDLVNDIDE